MSKKHSYLSYEIRLKLTYHRQLFACCFFLSFSTNRTTKRIQDLSSKGTGIKMIKFIICFIFRYQTKTLQIKPALQNSGFPVHINNKKVKYNITLVCQRWKSLTIFTSNRDSLEYQYAKKMKSKHLQKRDQFSVFTCSIQVNRG